MIFRHTIINIFFLSFPKSPIIARRHLEQKSAVLAQRRQNIEKSNLSRGWQANVGPTSAKSADLATNSQRRSDGGMLSGVMGTLD